MIVSRVNRRVDVAHAQFHRTAVVLGPGDDIAAVVVKVDRRPIGVRGDHLRVDKRRLLTRRVERPVEGLPLEPNDNRDTVGGLHGIRLAVIGGPPQLDIDQNIAGGRQPGLVEPARLDPREIVIPLGVGRPADREAAILIDRRRRLLLSPVLFDVDLELIGQRPDPLDDELGRIGSVDVRLRRVNVRHRRVLERAPVPRPGPPVDTEGRPENGIPRGGRHGGGVDIALNREAASEDVGVVVGVVFILHRALPGDDEGTEVVERDRRTVLIGLAVGDDHRVPLDVGDRLPVVVERVDRELGLVDAEDRAGLFKRIDVILRAGELLNQTEVLVELAGPGPARLDIERL